ncbi:MAG: dTDP-4-dehydrorhamnose reductase [Crocinitomicaceae bacterium]|nr:dTDP-4-dehydrorhamnose reductase [Crocinitomicaceae bacterium]
MLKVLITGKNGQLGSTFQELATSVADIEFIFKDSKELDITDFKQVEGVLSTDKPNIIVNCAAYTAVDRAEEEPEQADLVNHIGVKNLAMMCKNRNIGLIHISTDYVFDGEKGSPYEVADPTNPINVYGKTKLAGELAMQAINPNGCIIRTSWVYSKYGSNFVKTMLRLSKEKDEINVVADQYGSPTYATDLANACISLMKNVENWKDGTEIYHYSNEGVISWYEFAKEIMVITKINCNVIAIESKKFKTLARRPKRTALNPHPQKILGNLVNWKESLVINLKEKDGLE